MLRLHRTLLALVVFVVPACGGDISVPAPLLTEQFNGGFPGVNWTVPTVTGAGAAVQITGGVLTFTGTTMASSAKTTTTAAFTNPNLSVLLQMGILATAGQNGVGTIEILDATPAVVAVLTWDAGASTLTYTIGATTLSPPGPPATDGTLTGFRFGVDAMGTASWSRNNTPIGTSPAFPAGPLKIRLGGSFGNSATWPEFRFDNISVTSP
jgi:hypothetical protein